MKKFISFCILIIFSFSIFAATTTDTTAEPYSKDEFPDWVRYLRRYEIISLGSLPFTTMTVTTVYTVYRYIDKDFDSNYVPNPLALSSTAANLDSDEQMNILYAAIGTSLVVGTVDLVIHIIKKEKAKKINAANFLPKEISINSIEETEIPENPPENPNLNQPQLDVQDNPEIIDGNN